ncbi:sensor histidine kinase [Acetobacter oeni]|uniref:histidine kinase n=1 Tax=Acetobacter oeni TaxID=304077 RepID=A0A511XHV1_9PROT|nr:HAMP domain-containing sensor histidine kinase [Acetobacter oeni]MBB3882584.1 signal transduction histidine kinase [Acetobacter oeni]NHO18607.1 sensor histidine kinase [Acetobacter oeni]GBR12040.1 signal transduction histidine kinase [Acetobacter oeni LMG 21952]GEN62481.1 histidine kinase [Acetobacter oeni]
MRFLPKSLTGRLLVTATLSIIVALVIATAFISHILEGFVLHGLDERLDAQIEALAGSLGADGTPDRAKIPDIFPFSRPGSGWAWEIITPDETLVSASLGADTLHLPTYWKQIPPRPPHGPGSHRTHAFSHGGHHLHPRPLDGQDSSGRTVHYRIADLKTPDGTVSIITMAPRALVERPLRTAMFPLIFSIAALGLFLTTALIVQLRVGLRPLTTLRATLRDVQTGKARRIKATEPTELLPLIQEINSLIATNEQALSNARGHVANLAHGLKTPLATLRLDLEDGGSHPDSALLGLVTRMEQQIRHHLGRARMVETAAGEAAVPPEPLAPHVADLAAALRRIHADRNVTAETDIPETLSVRCDPQDLDELLGNVLDNAWRYARSAVHIDATRKDRFARLDITDDGPGMTPADMDKAILKGQRLDEREPGHGFGLPIAREIAELHGGSLTLRPAASGGLCVTLRLPAG